MVARAGGGSYEQGHCRLQFKMTLTNRMVQMGMVIRLTDNKRPLLKGNDEEIMNTGDNVRQKQTALRPMATEHDGLLE